MSTAVSHAENRPLITGMPLRLIAGGLLLLNGFFPALWILFTSLRGRDPEPEPWHGEGEP